MSMTEQTFGTLLSTVAAKTPTPGGGAVTAAVGALSAALASMVVAYTTGKKDFASHEAELKRAAETLTRARTLMLELAEEDETAYAELNLLMKLPENDSKRQAEMPTVARAATQVPLAVVAACVDLLRLFHRLTTITNPRLKSDLAIAAVLAESVARASRWNVAINLPLLPEDGERADVMAACEEMIAEGGRALEAIEEACE